jgi:hypothetical protein
MEEALKRNFPAFLANGGDEEMGIRVSAIYELNADVQKMSNK